MADSRRALTAPWIVSAVAAAVLIATLLVYFLVLRPDEDNVPGAFTSSETAAMNAAAQEIVNTLTYTRAHFDADFQRALDGTTGDLRTDVSKNKADTLAAMTQGKFDLSAQVTHKALVGPVSSGKQQGYVVLVTVNGFQSNAKDAPKPNDLEVTVVKVKGKWLLSGITSFGVTG